MGSNAKIGHSLIRTDPAQPRQLEKCNIARTYPSNTSSIPLESKVPEEDSAKTGPTQLNAATQSGKRTSGWYWLS
ncbi:hypothetical protein Pla110_12360 [Polystyrenella longa]|uniref:Uncharacterized protein n=1 Tax=Polystyrenella longa TaxID=2528007 RepID=A0A518CJW6_9PLAN|nr:hypothetical protein Pla110_12360 [Polystyrenella longa]